MPAHKHTHVRLCVAGHFHDNVNTKTVPPPEVPLICISFACFLSDRRHLTLTVAGKLWHDPVCFLLSLRLSLFLTVCFSLSLCHLTSSLNVCSSLALLSHPAVCSHNGVSQSGVPSPSPLIHLQPQPLCLLSLCQLASFTSCFSAPLICKHFSSITSRPSPSLAPV